MSTDDCQLVPDGAIRVFWPLLSMGVACQTWCWHRLCLCSEQAEAQEMLRTCEGQVSSVAWMCDVPTWSMVSS